MGVDLGIDTGEPPVRLSYGRSAKAPSPVGPIVGLVIMTVIITAVGLAAWRAEVKRPARAPVALSASNPSPQLSTPKPTPEQIRFAATMFGEKGTQAQIQEELALQRANLVRLRAAADLAGYDPPIVDSTELDGGRRVAFLCFRKDGQFFTKIVESGTVQTFHSGDHYAWETSTNEGLAIEWATEHAPDEAAGEFIAESATRGPFRFDAVVVNKANGVRWRVEMNGWHPAGDAMITMTRIRE